jgi:hypothetical protein
MILNPTQQKSDDTGPATLRDRLARQLEACCGDLASPGFAELEDVAHAVARFVEETTPRRAVHSRQLTMLAARALASLGEKRAARRVLLQGSGLVSPSRWQSAGHEALWVLDLHRMTAEGGGWIEIAFFRGLLGVLDMAADVWDDTRGAGVLGLRRMRAAAVDVHGHGGTQSASEDLRREIKHVCSRKLEAIAKRRHWTSVPMVMDLEFEP